MMTPRGRSVPVHAIRSTRGRSRGAVHRQLIGVGLFLAICCFPVRAQPPPPADGWVAFEANWSASGHQHTLAMGDRKASIFELAGPFLVTSGEGLSRGFRAEAIGFVDRGSIGIGRLLLTDERGDEIFNDLQGQAPGTGTRIRGTISGGTGRYAGLVGDFEFDWRYVIHAADGAIQGRAVGLKGRFSRSSDLPRHPGQGEGP